MKDPNLTKTTMLLLALLTLSHLTSASIPVPANGSDVPCPDESDIVYSPFKPWFSFYSGGNSQMCWKTAMCILGQTDEARMQQYGATALVMGLLPITLRDIAWPERRVVVVSDPLPAIAAVAVRALGLEPIVQNEAGWPEEDMQRWMAWAQGSWTMGVGARHKATTRVLLAASLIALLGTYGALAVIELYSKGSALGCPYPVFALTWCIAAVIPATIHTVLANLRRKSNKERVKEGRVSAVQGVDEAWPVQLSWAIFYIAGTLIYTSIMAVTVLELFVWVVVQILVTAASKLFALYICVLLRNPTAVNAALTPRLD